MVEGEIDVPVVLRLDDVLQPDDVLVATQSLTGGGDGRYDITDDDDDDGR